MADDLEREIEEILDKLDQFVPEESAASRMRRRWGDRVYNLQRAVANRLSRISLGHLMVASLLLIIVAFALRWTVFGRYALVAGLILLFSTIAVSFFTAQRPKREKRWRGHVVDLSGPNLAERLRNRLRGWWRRAKRS
jgi:uncharacterized membrane protein